MARVLALESSSFAWQAECPMSLSLAFLTLGMLQNLWGRPSACGGLSGRPDGLSITYRGLSTARGSSMTRPSRRESAISKPAQADVDVGRRTECLPHLRS